MKSGESFGDKDMEDIMVVVCPKPGPNKTCFLMRRAYRMGLKPDIRAKYPGYLSALYFMEEREFSDFHRIVNTAPPDVQLVLSEAAFFWRSHRSENLGVYLRALRRNEELPRLLEVFKIIPKETRTLEEYRYAVDACFLLKNYELAAEFLSEQLLTETDDIGNYNLLGIANNELRRFEKTVALLTGVPRSKWDKTTPRILMEAYNGLGRYGAAVSLKGQLPREQWDQRMFWQVALAHIRLGQHFKAIDELLRYEREWSRRSLGLLNQAVNFLLRDSKIEWRTWDFNNLLSACIKLERYRDAAGLLEVFPRRKRNGRTYRLARIIRRNLS